MSFAHMLVVNFSDLHGCVPLTIQLFALLSLCTAVMTLLLPVQVTDTVDAFPSGFYILFVATLVSFAGFMHASYVLSSDDSKN